MKPFDRFRKQVEAAGLAAVDRGQGHWQITGGKLLVNYYPAKQTIYVAGMVGSVRGDYGAAIASTRELPHVCGPRDHRKRASYRKVRMKMLRKSTACHWCKSPLTIDTSTIDHVIPLSRGGLDNANNRVLACEPCNSGRGNQMPELATA